LGTNKRYGDRIDERAASRRTAPPPPASAPGTWHPRVDAYPTAWTCRNGRWGTTYGRVEAEDVHRDMLWSTVYRAWAIHEGMRTDLGEFPTGDAAVEACWAAFTARIEAQSMNRR